MGHAIDNEWKQNFVAYEDALASFYALQDLNPAPLEHAHAIARQREHLANARKLLVDVRRRLRASSIDGRVAEIERQHTTIEMDGSIVDALDLVANRASDNDTLLELSFRVAPRSVPRFFKLTEPIRIRFPFGESTYVALCRLVRFRMVRDEFAFRFATVDPV